MDPQTLKEDAAHERAGARSLPGVVVVFGGERPQCIALPLKGGALQLGRDELAAAGVPDGRDSRRHVRVERAGEGWCPGV